MTPTKRHKQTNKKLLRRPTGNRRVPRTHEPIALQRVWRLVRRLAVWTMMLLLLAGAGLGIYHGYRALGESGRFALQEVILSGNRTVELDEVLSYAGLKLGIPMIHIVPGQVADRIAKHPWVRDVAVRRILPDKLGIEITERRARAVAALDHLYLVDDEGEAFLRIRPVQLSAASGQPLLAHLPLITGVDRLRYTTSPRRSRELLLMAMDLHHDLQESELLGGKRGWTLSEIHVDWHLGLELELEPGPVRLSLGWRDYPTRLRHAARVLTALEQRGKQPRMIHLDNDRRPGRTVARLTNAFTTGIIEARR